MTKTRQWLLLDAVAFVVVLVVGWFLLIAPQRTEAAELDLAAGAESARMQSMTSQLQVLRAQAAELPARQAQLAELQTLVPAETSLPDLIRMLTAAAEDSGVVLVTLTPGQGEAATEFVRTPVTLEVEGGFFALEQYLLALEDLPRAFVVGGFTVQPKQAGSDVLRMSLTGTVFTAGTAGGAAPPAAPAAQPAPGEPAAAPPATPATDSQPAGAPAAEGDVGSPGPVQ